MNKTEIEAMFAKFVRNEGNDRAEVTDMLWRMNSSDRVKLLTSAEFVDIAVKNAAALGIVNTPEELEEDDYVLTREDWVDAVNNGDTDASFEDWMGDEA